MGMLAGQWWQSVDVWAIVVSSLVALLVGWLGAWATLRAGNQKRQIGWWVEANTSLFALPQYSGGSGPLTVNLGNTRVEKPRIIELVIANLGKRDVPATMFHDGAPLKFSFGAPVLLILEYKAKLGNDLSQSLDTYADHGAMPTGPLVGGLQLKPTLLRAGQVITVTVLVDGDLRPARCADFPLIDVEEIEGPLRVTAFRAVLEAVKAEWNQ
ncbi:hypothetical protein ACFWC5_01185 [Streptomyces sp. NPDC060085]|uniref:hypothetical protein n=1 Tax=Streptomyces sp. NPDC060085 TaxID=3347054 RepID=UPI0036632BD0